MQKETHLQKQNLPSRPIVSLTLNTSGASMITWTGGYFAKYYEVSTVTGSGKDIRHKVIVSRKKCLKDKFFRISPDMLKSEPQAFSVRGMNAAGDGEWSEPIMVTQPEEVPAVEEKKKKERKPLTRGQWALWVLLLLFLLLLTAAAVYQNSPETRAWVQSHWPTKACMSDTSVSPTTAKTCAPAANICPEKIPSTEMISVQVLRDVSEIFVDAFTRINAAKLVQTPTQCSAQPPCQERQVESSVGPTDGAVERFDLPTPEAIDSVNKYGGANITDTINPGEYVYYPIKKGYKIKPYIDLAGGNLKEWYNDTPVEEYCSTSQADGIKWIKIRSYSDTPQHYNFSVTPNQP